MNRRLLLLLIPIVVGGCTSSYDKANPCSGSAPPFSSNRPVVCVDDTNLANITSMPEMAKGKRKAPIKWFTTSGQSGMTITFANDACVKQSTVNCNAGSRCEAQIVDTGATGTQCKYTVTLTRNGVGHTEDPIVIIDDGVYVEQQ
jgi:hypothetical protein